MLVRRACSLVVELQSLRHACNDARTFITSHAQHKKALPPRPKLSDDSVRHVSLKGSGPGGQKINKTSSAIQITHLATGVVVKSQATRSRTQNYKIAREILAEKIELLEKGDESRAAKKIEVKSKRKASAVKKARRKYRKLEEGKESGEGVAEDHVDQEEENVEGQEDNPKEIKDIAGG